MDSNSDVNIDEETIQKLGLRPSENLINAPLAPEARVFNYPFLADVFIMESDLYGNKMPKDSCFLAFKGKQGLVGKHLSVETLRNASIKDIKDMVENNREG